jgi:hypothetical protein
MRLRIHRFFPPGLGVRFQAVAGSLPTIPQPLQFAADRVCGGLQVGVLPQMFLEQGYGPDRGRVTLILRAAGEQFAKQVPLRLRQQRGPATPITVGQHHRVVFGGVRGKPVVDRSSGHSQLVRHRGDGLAGGDLQDGQGAAVDAGITGGL